MSKVYVTGHRNPDTDSIVAAISYASLRNALGDRDYTAAHLDHITDETKRLLEYFEIEPPERLRTVRTQVRDLDFDTPPILNSSVTMDRAWHTLQEMKINTLPVINEDGTLYGLLSSDGLAEYNMKAIENGDVKNIPLFNLLSVLEGRTLSEDNVKDSISGEVIIAVPQSIDTLLFQKKESIVICGCQPEMIRRALDLGVNCLILCQTDVRSEWIENPGDTMIITTPLDIRRTVCEIYQASPVSLACHTHKLVCFHLDDFIDDVREKMLESRYHSYPVLDENEKVVGLITRYHLLRPRRKRVVLVDHNESAQAVPGLDQAEIVEIIDHHRLADIQTIQPIHVRNEPVGSTVTIITEMYQEHGVLPSPKMAGLMAGAIMADTVMFKSPTCTKRDIAMAKRMVRIANTSLEVIGRELFSNNFNDQSDLFELLNRDFKEFNIAEKNFGVGQITCYESEKILERKDDFLALMKEKQVAKGYDFIMLMITDVLIGGTRMLILGNEEVIRFAFQVEPVDHMVFLPGVMSRKKQVIPMLTALWG